MLFESFELRRPSRTPDGLGGWTEAETSVGFVRGQMAAEAFVPLEPTVGAGVVAYQVALDARRGPEVKAGDILVDRLGRRYRISQVRREGRWAVARATMEGLS